MSLYIQLRNSFFFFKDLFIWGKGRGRESEAGAPLSTEPRIRLDPTTPDHDPSGNQEAASPSELPGHPVELDLRYFKQTLKQPV